MIEKLLEKLETINWIELKGSTGRNAGDIPSIFRDILSNNLETRNDAHLKLLLALNGDYLVGTASLIVIPFLIELLSMEGIPDKDKILFFLDDILIYPVPQIADEEKTISRFRNRDIRIKIAEEVWKGIDVYIDLLENDGELIQDSTDFPAI